MSKINLISSCNVCMSTKDGSNVPENPISRLELTPWDLQLLQLHPIQKGILFHKLQSQKFGKTFIDHLKKSLSLTLGFFPPLAGRLGTIHNDDDNTVCFFVDCNNAGAEFTHAIAPDVSVSHILGPTYTPEIVSSFFPLNGISNFEGVSNPLLGVQVTELVDGFFIGLTANHAVVDGTSFWQFFNSWSEISRGTCDTISKLPVFERWFPNKNIMCPIPIPQPVHFNQPIPTPLLERVFNFSTESVAKLKVKANSETGTEKTVSSLQALVAHLLRSATRARRQSICSNNFDDGSETLLLLAVGTRSRIPLSDGYFGNAIHLVQTSINEHELLQHGLGWAALKINELVARETSEAAVKIVEDWIENPTLLANFKSTNKILLSSSPRYNVYGNDFGWGKPITVRSGKGQKCDGKLTVFEAAESGGIDVEACLAPETMHAMEEDAEFIEAFIN